METIAITEWNDVVSPLYDSACSLCIVLPDGVRTSHNVRNCSLADKADLIAKHGVGVMICGAISATAREQLHEKGVIVLSWICGPVDLVIDAYRRENDIATAFAMPGCRKQECAVGAKNQSCHRRNVGRRPHAGRTIS